MKPVTLLTDFGTTDDQAGVCHAVIAMRCPGAEVVHLTHGITPQAVLEGALVMRDTLRFLPVGVHVGVVDPGVGTDRLALAVEAADGRVFVGPDNGLLVPAIDASGGAVQAVSITSEQVVLQPMSATFHGRDVFAPAAAHLAAGGALGDLGPEVDVAKLRRLELPEPSVRPDGSVTAKVWHVDRFGNAALHLDAATFQRVLDGGHRVELQVRADRYYAEVVETFGNVRPGSILAYVGPYGNVSIAVNRGDAASMFRLCAGDDVTLAPLPASISDVRAAASFAMQPRSR